jgi:hypothetical protein
MSFGKNICRLAALFLKKQRMFNNEVYSFQEITSKVFVIFGRVFIAASYLIDRLIST